MTQIAERPAPIPEPEEPRKKGKIREFLGTKRGKTTAIAGVALAAVGAVTAAVGVGGSESTPPQSPPIAEAPRHLDFSPDTAKALAHCTVNPVFNKSDDDMYTNGANSYKMGEVGVTVNVNVAPLDKKCVALRKQAAAQGMKLKFERTVQPVKLDQQGQMTGSTLEQVNNRSDIPELIETPGAQGAQPDTSQYVYAGASLKTNDPETKSIAFVFTDRVDITQDGTTYEGEVMTPIADPDKGWTRFTYDPHLPRENDKYDGGVGISDDVRGGWVLAADGAEGPVKPHEIATQVDR